MSRGAVDLSAGAARARSLVIAIGLVVVVLDQLSKIWAVASLTDGPIPVLAPVLSFELTHNPGAAFGSFTGAGWVLGLIAIGATTGIVIWAGRIRRLPTLIGLGLIAGGAIGNVVDRLTRPPGGFLGGHVVDFIKFPHWPNFNVADSAVFVGVILVVLTYRPDERVSPAPAADGDAEDSEQEPE